MGGETKTKKTCCPYCQIEIVFLNNYLKFRQLCHKPPPLLLIQETTLFPVIFPWIKKQSMLLNQKKKYEHQSIDATSNEQAVSLSEDSFPMATTIMMSLLPRKRKWPSSLKSLFCINSIVESNKIEYEESGVCDLQKLPEISTQYRLKEINGFGVLSTTQSLTPANQQIYQKLVATGLELSLEFCRYLEILNERSMKQDIKDSFLIQFGRIHSGLPFTTNHTNSDATKEELLHIGELFDEVFNNNNTVWIANKFEYNSFGRKFRKAIVETLESDYQIRISHRRDLFPRQMIAASLFQWKKNIHLPE